MKLSYLSRESERVNAATRKMLFRSVVVFDCALAVIYFFGISSDESFLSSVSSYILACAGIVTIAAIIKLISTYRPATKGENLILPYGVLTPEAVARCVDQEAMDGNILVDEYINEFADRKKAHGDKIVLTPSYLLLCTVKRGVSGTSQITAIPINKIYWLCAQVGRKGGPFKVRLLVFAENKVFTLEGVDIEHAKAIADKLYHYIPNVFSCYDPFDISYGFEESYDKDPRVFLTLYQHFAENWKRDRSICETLEQNGDLLTATRKIDFYIHFKNEADVDSVGEKLLAQGFIEASREKSENGEYKLIMTLEATPDLNNINKVTSGILSVLLSVDAVLDGWGCAVIKDD